MEIDYIILTLFLGISSSIFASFIFVFYTSRMKPKIIISDKIAMEKKLDGSYDFFIKIINKTRFNIINVRAEVRFIDPQNISKGVVRVTRNLKLRNGSVYDISKYNKKDDDAMYAYWFRIEEDIRGMWNGRSYIRFKVYAEHSLSGFGKVYTMNYMMPTDVIEGRFVFGDCTDITPI